jgi:RsiW-degrading membrane proteinase PrsW (M82 family)
VPPINGMNINFVAIAASCMLGVFCIHKFRGYDIYEQESWLKLLCVLCVGGAVAVGLTACMYLPLRGFMSREFMPSVAGSYFFVAPMEECAKILSLVLTVRLWRRTNREPTDGVLYMACIALGFSLVESWEYARRYPDSDWILLYRLAINSPMQMMASAVVGYAMHNRTQAAGTISMLLSMFMLAVFIHGTGEALIATRVAAPAAPLLGIITFFGLKRVIQFTNLTSPYRRTLKEYTQMNQAVEMYGVECLQCGNTGLKLGYRVRANRGFSFQRCGQCGWFVATAQDLMRLFRFFSPQMKRLRSAYVPKHDGTAHCSLYDCATIDPVKKIGAFELEAANTRILALNRALLATVMDSQLFRFIVRTKAH